MRRRTNARGPLFEEGERVWLRAHAFVGQDGAPKLHCAYYGPYVITKRVNDNAYKLHGLPDGVHSTQNVSELRPFVESPVRFRTRPKPPVPQPIFVNGHEEWEVDDIIGYRQRGNHLEYRIKWRDCPQTSWVKRSQLENAPRLLKRFEKAHGLATTATRRTRR